jgi:UDP-2,3-diacylglucosamine pyrophosphatase LpxH
LQLQQKGCRVIYIPGNHDDVMRRYLKHFFAGVEIQPDAIYTSIKQKKFLVCHGDQFDSHVCLGKWQMYLGDALYDLLLFINRWYNKLRGLFGKKYFSLANLIKQKIPKATEAILRYQDACLNYAQKKGLDGVICGHIHYPEIVHKNNMTYINDGDWIENCTAFVEYHNGEMELIYWVEQRQSLIKLAEVA